MNRKAYGIVLVYDISDNHYFEDIKDQIQNIREAAKANVPIILIGNKKDLKY